MAVPIGTTISLTPIWDFEYVKDPIVPSTAIQRFVYTVDADVFNSVAVGNDHWGIIANVAGERKTTVLDRRGNRLWTNGTGLIFHVDGSINEEVWFNNSSCEADATVHGMRGPLGVKRYYRITMENRSTGQRVWLVEGRNTTGESWETLLADNEGQLVSTRRTQTTCVFCTGGGITAVCESINNI